MTVFFGSAGAWTLLCLLLLMPFTGLPQSPAPTVSTVESLGAIPAAQVLSGLGWNLSPANSWEFQAAAAAGSTHARFQCSWGDAYGGRGGGGELQSPPPANVSQGYQMPANCAQGIALAKQYGMKPTILAAYGPPYQQILTLTTTAAAAAGATSLPVSFVSGVGGDTLSTIAYPNDYLHASNLSGFLSPAHSYAGTLISGITLTNATQAIVSLASATQVAVPSGTTLIVNRVLYPSAATNNQSDPSIQAYIGFVRFLGNQCVAAAISCEIEIWNEPAWPDECWDSRRDCFDYTASSPFNEEYFGPNWGFVAALQSLPLTAGVTYNWSGPHKSGDGTVLSPNMQQNSGTSFAEPASRVTVESLHPYGNNPEDNMWNEPCYVALKTTSNWGACNTISTSSSNAGEVEARSILAKQTNPSYGIAHAITETGFAGTVGDDAHKARFLMRQFLGFMAANIQFIEFYRLYDSDASTDFSFMRYANGTPSPLPAYTALAGLIADLRSIPNAAVTPISSTSLSTVMTYSGTYPLDIAHFVGSRLGDTANSDFVTVWQRSYAAASPGWAKLASPPTAPVTLSIPLGMFVKQLINLDTRAPIAFTTAGQQVTFNVSDDPVEVLVEPLAPTPTLAVTPMAMSYGTASLSLTTQVAYTGAIAPTGALNFTVDGGIALPAICAGSTSPLSCTAIAATATLAAGNHLVTANVAADTIYSAASTSALLTVTAQSPTVTVTAVSIPYGTASTPLTARVSYTGQAAPTGSFSFTLDSGPAIGATCTGANSLLTCTTTVNTTTLTTGIHVVTASLAADANYLTANANASLTVTPQSTMASTIRGVSAKNTNFK